MNYKLQDNVFFKKIADDQVNILLADNDNFIFKLNKVAAQTFLMLVDKNLSTDQVRTEVLSITKKPEADVDRFLSEFYHQMTEHKFITKA